MIKIKIVKQDNKIGKISVEGHSGYADGGQDIVCASISTLIFTLIESMDGVLALDKSQYTYTIDPQIPLIDFELYIDKLSQDQIKLAGVLTQTFQLGAIKSSAGYEDFVDIRIQEV